MKTNYQRLTAQQFQLFRSWRRRPSHRGNAPGLRRSAGAFVLMLLASTAAATAIAWTNPSNGNWSVPANWSPNQVPTTNDFVAITNAGTYTITLDLDPTIAGLVLGADSGIQTLTTAGRTFTLNGSAVVETNGVFHLNGGALSGPTQLDLYGTFLWNRGAIDTNATVTVATGGQVAISSSANYTKYLYGTLTNHGTITWQLYGNLFISGVLHNTGLFDAQLDRTLYGGGRGIIVNTGVFRKTASSGILDCEVPLINCGTVDTQTGQLNLAAGSRFAEGCEFIGAGETWMATGTNALSGRIHTENLTLKYSATLAGTGSFSGTLKWGGGSIGPEAIVTVATNGTLLIASPANYVKSLAGFLTNAGTIIWQPHSGMLISGVLHNLPGALFDAQMDGTINQGGGGLILNEGILRKSVGSGPVNCAVPLINCGTVDTQIGSIVLSDGSIFNSGCAFIGAGTTRLDSGTNTLSGSLYSENLVVLYNATLTGTGSISGTLTWSGGSIGPEAFVTVAPTGILLIASSANHVKHLYGCLTNAGTIVWQPHSGLNIAGRVHNLPGAVFDAQLAGAIYQGGGGLIINDGEFRKTADSGTVTCAASFLNNGTVEVSAGTLYFEGAYTNHTGTILLAGGTFRTRSPLWLAGGLLTGWGTVNADVTNAGTVRPARTHGGLQIQGNYEQTIGGLTAFELAGNVPGTNQSRLSITGAAGLRGSVGVHWVEDYLPFPGTTFPVLTFASRRGEFCCFDNFILLGHGRRLTPVYSPTSLTLATGAAPEPTTVPLRVTVDDGAIVCWPAEFPGYELYGTTNLGQTNWMLLFGATNRWLEAPPLAREKFFRLQKP
jgi:hypothetical protein